LPQLIELALGLDGGLTPDDFADAGLHLEKISDRRLAQYLSEGQDPAWLRDLLKDWPRTPQEALDLMGWAEWPAPPPGNWED
jgi:hypothetical protein